ncbi:MAG: GAK system CofD-like protein [gamma proteobacterium endosymbiont of Lamellibrachia anaximandri]|nr:GAK system CofD-like protein [gamma proteobacterium endosymbiont of Lamellibrachia anaximandri]MBL3617238.1 GAK system CofD-like protein [gamma proteobacterium endosymbiont of Lamellibrachia anaximandri]
MATVKVTRSAKIPDLVRINRYSRAPELGPRLLFFSGGSALTGVCQVLKQYTHNSTHLVTPFDSGGSSATLRKAFDMPSIGDLRSRLIALADDSVTGNPEVYSLFAHRFAKEVKNRDLLRQLDNMILGRDRMVEPISNPMRRLIRHQLGYFREAMPKRFDLRGASIGNLILAGGYLNNHQHLDPIIFLFSKLVEVRGTVRAVVNDHLHLGAKLEDGSQVIGQHRLTGKEVTPLASPIKKLFLSSRLDKAVPAEAILRKKNRKLIQRSELICYPPGSFYTSLLANLLPRGVGRAIVETDCPKVYIPNLGQDPEQIGMTSDRMVQALLAQLRADVPDASDDNRSLNYVLMDDRKGAYPSSLSNGLMKELGVQVVQVPLVSKRSAPYYDAELLVAALLSMT